MFSWFFILFSAAAWAHPELDAGRGFLAEKLPDPAIISLERCLEDEPENPDCHWELGWAHWLKGDWGNVVKIWEKVERLDPGRDGLPSFLAQAKAQHTPTTAHQGW